LLFCATAAAAPALPEAQRALLDDGVRSGTLHEVAVGWIDHGESTTAFFGAATAESRFEIGTLTETFSGVLLAQAAFENKLRVHDTLHEQLGGIPLSSALAGVTLESLATHRAGLPALPGNLMPDDLDDPYAAYSAADLRAWLVRGETNGAGYSPLDFGVLGWVLARSYDATDFGAVLHDKVLAPLGLAHTDYDDAGLLPGHARGGGAPRWHFGALAAGAGLRSTLGDLLAFLQTNLKPEASPLRAALLLARQPRDGGAALGWNIEQSAADGQPWPVLWRASVTAGHAAFIGFRTDRQQALVLLSDDDVDLSAFGMSLLDDRAVPTLPKLHVAAAPPVDAAEFAGLYQIHNGGAELVVRARGAALSAQLAGEPASNLTPLGDDIFDADTFLLTFQREGSRIVSVILSRNGVNGVAERLSGRAPQLARAPVDATAAQWDELRGDYVLGRGTLLRIARREDRATLQVTARARVELGAYGKDRFRCLDDSCELRVRRDADGKLCALEVDFAGGVRVATRRPDAP
jgi:CubicO group peptidase (beta-lactamase class C family)